MFISTKTLQMKHCIPLFLAGLVVINGYPKQRLYLDSIDYSALQDNTMMQQDQMSLQNEQEIGGDYGIKYIGGTDDQMKSYKLASLIGKDLSDNLMRYRRLPFGLNTKQRKKIPK